jgi:hypothetical protein
MIVSLELPKGTNQIFSNVTICRSSSENNFATWEDVYTGVYSSEKTFKWIDRTIKSGIYYRYGICKRDTQGNRSSIVKDKNKVVNCFEDVYLSSGGRHLRIKYNPQVSSFKYTVMESKIETIGSQFPFIIRNGDV